MRTHQSVTTFQDSQNAYVPPRRTPPGIEQRLLARARQRGLQPGQRLIVGFSGGRDSLVLASALRRVEHVLHVQPVLVHVDHQLRPESEFDAERAMALAHRLGMEAASRRLSSHPVREHSGVGIEEAARRERYRVLLAEARERGAIAVVTAHHEADQAETVLMHLLRGAGVHGAAGMAEWTSFPAMVGVAERDISQEGEQQGIGLWRPFLEESRAAIDRALQELGLEPVDDPSNTDTSFRRNALRHEVLPVLESHYPGAVASLARYARLAAEDDRTLQAMAEGWYATAVDPGGYFRFGAVPDQPLSVRRRLLREWVQRLTGIDLLSAERTAAVMALANDGEPGSIIDIGGGWCVRRMPGALRVEFNGNDGTMGEVGTDD